MFVDGHLQKTYVWAVTQQHAHPWEARYTGELRSVTQHQHVEAMLFLQGMAMLATHLDCSPNFQRRETLTEDACQLGRRSKLLCGQKLLLHLLELCTGVQPGGESTINVDILWVPIGNYDAA
eukprot:jgi/Chrzof1/12633/Cz07g01260.t1